ncbi:hypothetical protein Sango_2949300 [Sesamum angolense]|uniref:Uncharacterized protein n=1 Tax=Sesamum angolense TaxID=2727404 RepID=A0AAE1T5J1_9LAMI|nr:hypothetical protein Sango_2949300 [Sesamum angolense]
MLTRTLLRRIKVGRRCTPRGDRARQLPCALRVYSPVDSHTCQTPWSVFQDGSNGEPAGQRRERAVAEARPRARAVRHDRGDGVPRAYRLPGLWPPPQSALVRAPSRSADRLSPFHIRPGRIAGPHPLPSRQFQALFDSLFKVLFIFPSRYLFAIGLSPVFSLGRNLPPIGLHSQTTRLADSASWCGRVRARRGSPSPAPLSRGLGPGPPLRTLLQTTIRTAKPPDSQVGLFPVRSPLLGESLRERLWVQRDARADDAERGTTARELRVQPPLVVTGIAAGSHLGRPRARAHGRPVSAPPHRRWGGDAMRDAQADVPWPNGFGRNLRSKTRWFTGFCNSHQVSHFATFFIDARAEISVAESRFDIRYTSPPHGRPADGAARRTLRSVFLGAFRAGGSLARTARARARRREVGPGPPFCWRRVRGLLLQVSTMILPQVHLRKPCYDFSFL